MSNSSIPFEGNTPEMTELTLTPGIYKLEVWGAQGGFYSSSYSSYAGKGGYSYGTLNLTNDTIVYVYVGGSGNAGTELRGFNGGGAFLTTSGPNTRSYSNSYSGGGASDIRIGTDSLYARVIVAGGGGGSSYYVSMSPYTSSSGYTSWTTTGQSYYNNRGTAGGGTSSASINGYTTVQATQTKAGSYGSFGQGSPGAVSSSNYSYTIGGGGGGWYGGGRTSIGSSSNSRFSGGGSGYVYTSSTYSNYPSGCLLNSSYYLTDAETVGGWSSFVDYDGTTVTGHQGNGAARITKIEYYKVYSIPRVIGITDLSITAGQNADLTTGITYECEVDKSDCTYHGPSITNTSSLATGTHTIYYVVESSEGIKYKYPRTIVVG